MTREGTFGTMTPVEALEQIAQLLIRAREPRYKAQAFQRAAKAIAPFGDDELRRLAGAGRLQQIPGVGDATAAVVADVLAGRTPAYLDKLLGRVEERRTDAGEQLRQALRGDLHLHSDWSDGGAPILAMATKARDLGHDYIALTDHSPRLTIANGLSPERLRQQIDVVAEVNRELAPFRVLTGIEVDINEDGTLDQEEELLAQIDVVVASVHSKLRMERAPMTKRMVRAIENPYCDVLGHCTGRLLVGRGRPESEFDENEVFAACREHDKAVEVNCRPERLDPPRRMLERIAELEVKVAIDTDAHATDQLEWHPFGTDRVAEYSIPVERVVNAWPVEQLLAWCASHHP
jgi:putative hydrolase